MNTASLMLSIVFGSIGIGYFMYGKKQSNMLIRYTGVSLIVYPYFIDNLVVMGIIGVGLMFLPKLMSSIDQ